MSQTTDNGARTTDPQRAQLLRRLHAEAYKRGIRHELLSANACAIFSVRSLRELSVGQLRQYIDELTRTQQKKPTRPAGKRRPEGVVWLPTPRQRTFIASLLRRLFEDHPEPMEAAVRYTQRKLGPDLGTVEGTDAAAIAAAVVTGRAAGQLIKVLVGELKQRGKWKD